MTIGSSCHFTPDQDQEPKKKTLQNNGPGHGWQFWTFRMAPSILCGPQSPRILHDQGGCGMGSTLTRHDGIWQLRAGSWWSMVVVSENRGFIPQFSRFEWDKHNSPDKPKCKSKLHRSFNQNRSPKPKFGGRTKISADITGLTRKVHGSWTRGRTNSCQRSWPLVFGRKNGRILGELDPLML